MNTAIVSAHIYLDEYGERDIEILTQIDDDETTDIFCDIDHALLEQIEVDFEKDFPECVTKSYFFIAKVESNFVEEYHPEFGVEYDVEHEVVEIKNLKEFKEVITC